MVPRAVPQRRAFYSCAVYESGHLNELGLTDITLHFLLILFCEWFRSGCRERSSSLMVKLPE